MSSTATTRRLRALARPLTQNELADGPTVVTADMLEATYNRLLITTEQAGAAGAHSGAGDELEESSYLKIIDAFEMPAWRWGDERKGFEK